ncbi:GAF domain-containing protein [Psychroserpens sp. XS_ASV72]|uniref:GAF domain-containing protein n=1 Tax=Psychroserpens sp. XS_ASV72 TaxID=3241293 RepID=UPI003518994E
MFIGESMNDLNDNLESPLKLLVSFSKLLDHYEKLIKSDNEFLAAKAKRILKTAEAYPVLREGFSNVSTLKEREKEIEIILQDSFSPVLTNNEIKTASVPFHNLIFNSSERFKNIINEAGKDFELTIKNMPDEHRYIIACTIILKFCYGFSLNFRRPFYYEIPDKNGIMQYYKILYNADFTEIIPTENAPKITQDDVDLLLDNFDNIELWKEKFPRNSYIFKGFVISNIFNVTDDQAISNIKAALIAEDKRQSKGFMSDFQDIFTSLLGLNDVKVGFSIYNAREDRFERVYGVDMNSFLLDHEESENCCTALCKASYKRLLKEKTFYSISDVDKFYEQSKGEMPQIKKFKDQNIKSAILAPIANEDGLMGVLELVSEIPKALNSIVANKLNDVMPFIISAVERSKNDEANRIEAIIQQECTSIHPSVHWRFEKEARKFIKDQLNGKEPNFNKIAFEDVYPLYGQIDIKKSSQARNLATQKDLNIQLNSIKSIVEEALKIENLPVYEQYLYQINTYIKDLESNFQVDSEQVISSFIKEEIDPLLDHLTKTNKLTDQVQSYVDMIDQKSELLYDHRKQYDETIALINKEMASLLDKKQIEAQAMYPHYFERFKTDGVEHNMYIGESITKEESFNPVYLYNLRLWQLQVMCDMENAFYLMQSQFPMKLDVASMILVFNQPLSISFRMDEKQFDVDGTYNARYEIVKKRVDKAFIKGTNERITQKGKITIVYSNKNDETEYLRYVSFLQAKKQLHDDVEILELEDLQAVTGLKAIRVSVLYHKKSNDKNFYTYEDLIKELES